MSQLYKIQLTKYQASSLTKLLFKHTILEKDTTRGVTQMQILDILGAKSEEELDKYDELTYTLTRKQVKEASSVLDDRIEQMQRISQGLSDEEKRVAAKALILQYKELRGRFKTV